MMPHFLLEEMEIARAVARYRIVKTRFLLVDTSHLTLLGSLQTSSKLSMLKRLPSPLRYGRKLLIPVSFLEQRLPEAAPHSLFEATPR